MKCRRCKCEFEQEDSERVCEYCRTADNHDLPCMDSYKYMTNRYFVGNRIYSGFEMLNGQ